MGRRESEWSGWIPPVPPTPRLYWGFLQRSPTQEFRDVLLHDRSRLCASFAGHAAGASPRNVDWPRVGNDAGCMRYSQLDQINRENVTRLKPIWTYHTGELEGRRGRTIECTPIVIDGVMYVTTGYLRVVALDGATGTELWQFDPLKEHPFAYPLGVRRRQPRLRLLV